MVALVGTYLLLGGHADTAIPAASIGKVYVSPSTVATDTDYVARIASVTNAIPGISPSAVTLHDCVADRLSAACYQDGLNDLNHARTILDPSLPALNINLGALMAMTPAQQVFTITNIERVQRGLPPFTAMTRQLNNWAMTGAVNSTDPHKHSTTLTGGAVINSDTTGNFTASSYMNALIADYIWMYDDNTGNATSCTPTATNPHPEDRYGCWGHRQNILENYAHSCSTNDNYYMGAAFATVPPPKLPYSFTQVMLGACGPAPTDEVFTWAQALAAGVYTVPVVAHNCQGPTLYMYQTLKAGQCLISDNGLFMVDISGSGVPEIVSLYNGNPRQIWSTHCGPGYLNMQSDSNLVEDLNGGGACWSTGTHGLHGYRVRIENDGNLVMYTAVGDLVWSRLAGIIIDPPATLGNGQRLYPGGELFSSDNQYRLIVQTDGNLVVYNHDNQPTWASGTRGQSVAYLAMQGSDGNLVLRGTNGTALWTPTIQGMGGDHLTMQPDGNLVVYTSGNQAVWSTYLGQAYFPSSLYLGQRLYPGQQMLSPGHHYRLVLQGDSNLVLYNQTNQAVWSSGTAGRSVAYLVMQGDSNLILYDTSGNAVWNTNTRGMGGNHMAVQDDGNIIVYTGSNQATWSIQTGVIGFPAHLNMGQNLYPGQQLLSPNHTFRVILQTDGNLVVYNASNQPIWSSGTNGRSVAYLAMQGDSNLVLRGTDGVAVWTTTTQGMGGTYLSMQDDGNLIVYTSSNQATWSIQTGRINFPAHLYGGQYLYPGQQLLSPGHHFRLLLQGDGNLVIYNQYNQPIWSTGTNGRPTAYLAMQPDGNLILRDIYSNPIWISNTFGRGATDLALQDDGNLVLYTPSLHAVWSSQTGLL